MIKFLSAVIAVMLFAAFVTDQARADHDMGVTPFTLVVIEWQDDGSAALHEVYGPTPYANSQTCAMRSDALNSYIAETEPETRYVTACIHTLPGFTVMDVVRMIIRDYSGYFPPIPAKPFGVESNV